MSLYDSASRKPPLAADMQQQHHHEHQHQHQASAGMNTGMVMSTSSGAAPPPQVGNPFGDYADYVDAAAGGPSSSHEIVIVHVIPASNNDSLSQIGCIILSQELTERESFSFNFSLQNSLEVQSDYIASTLNNAVWIVLGDFATQPLLDRSFSLLNKAAPRPLRVIDASELFRQYQLDTAYISTSSARITSSRIYATLQRISLNNLLSYTLEALPERAQPQQTQASPPQQPQQPQQPSEQPIFSDLLPQQVAPPRAPPQQDVQDIQDPYQVDEVKQDNVYAEPSPPAKNLNGFHSPPQQPLQQQAASSPSPAPLQQQQQQPPPQQAMPATSPPQVLSGPTSASASIVEDISPSSAVKASSATSSVSSGFSWAAKIRTGSGTSSPPKRRAIGVVDRVSDNIYQKRSGGGSGMRGFAATKNPDGIRNSIEAAMRKKDIIWVSYNGHLKPFYPRGILPQKWEESSGKEIFYAIQHKSRAQTKQRFYLKNVLEVRNKQWRMPGSEMDGLKRKYGVPGGGGGQAGKKRRNGGGGGSGAQAGGGGGGKGAM